MLNLKMSLIATKFVNLKDNFCIFIYLKFFKDSLPHLIVVNYTFNIH